MQKVLFISVGVRTVLRFVVNVKKPRVTKVHDLLDFLELFMFINASLR